MKTTVKELKAYYVERGGSAATVANITTIPDMIVAITQLEHTSPAVELPKVTSTDNGDVLTVVEGKWAKAVPSGGGGGSFLVTITWDETSSEYVSDKTYAEITAAFESGQAVVAFSDPNIYELEQIDSDFIRFVLNSFTFTSGTSTLGLTSDAFKILSNDSVTEDYFSVKWTVTNNA